MMLLSSCQIYEATQMKTVQDPHNLLIRAVAALASLRNTILHKALAAAVGLHRQLTQLRYPPEADFRAREDIKSNCMKAVSYAQHAVRAISFAAGPQCTTFLQQQQQQHTAAATAAALEVGNLTGAGADWGVEAGAVKICDADVLKRGMEAAALFLVPAMLLPANAPVMPGMPRVMLWEDDVTSGRVSSENLLQLIKCSYTESTLLQQATQAFGMGPGAHSAEAVTEQSRLLKQDECCWNCGKRTAKDAAKAAGAGGADGSSSSNSSTKKLLRCSQCKRALYCSAECQKVHWKTVHRAMCKPSK
jgi:hypothetical protein